MVACGREAPKTQASVIPAPSLLERGGLPSAAPAPELDVVDERKKGED